MSGNDAGLSIGRAGEGKSKGGSQTVYISFSLIKVGKEEEFLPSVGKVEVQLDNVEVEVIIGCGGLPGTE